MAMVVLRPGGYDSCESDENDPKPPNRLGQAHRRIATTIGIVDDGRLSGSARDRPGRRSRLAKRP